MIHPAMVVVPQCACAIIGTYVAIREIRRGYVYGEPLKAIPWLLVGVLGMPVLLILQAAGLVAR